MVHQGKWFFVPALAVALIAAGTAKAVALTIGGEVATPETLNDTALGGTSVTATINGVQYSGSSVYSLISNAGFENDPAQAKNGNLLDYLSVTGANGQTVVLSEGQIDPNFGGQSSNPQIFIATTANGAAIAPQLIVQSDPNGTTDGYDVAGVQSVTVGWANVPALSTSALNTLSTFMVTGAVAGTPATYSTSNFSSAFSNQTTQTDTYLAGGSPTTKTFTGVSLYSLLVNAGLTADPNNPQSILNDYIVVTGSNAPTTSPADYAVLYSLGEIDPAFNSFTPSTLPLIAEVSGTTFRSTAPADSFGGRYDSDVVNIDVVDTVPEPSSLALMLAPLMLGFAFTRRWRARQA